MPNCWKIKVNNGSTKQSNEQLSFIGGYPSLPQGVNVPECSLCGNQQSFIFQIAFPEEHKWSGLSLAVFSCTSCADEEHLIPEMLQGSLQGIDIPNGFLESYQKNFRFIIFDTKTSHLNESYKQKVSYKTLELELCDKPDLNCNKVGGEPTWLLEDESPMSYGEGNDMHFLLQLVPDAQFELVDGAAPQMELNLMGEAEPSLEPYYQLFNGNAIYLFGSSDRGLPSVYAVTQI
jgi:hypothetical protein